MDEKNEVIASVRLVLESRIDVSRLAMAASSSRRVLIEDREFRESGVGREHVRRGERNRRVGRERNMVYEGDE